MNNAANIKGASNPINEAASNPINEAAEVIMQPVSEEVKDQNVHGADSVGDDEPWAFTESESEEFQASQKQAEEHAKAIEKMAQSALGKLAEMRQEPDLVKRIKAIRQFGCLDFPEVKVMHSGGVGVTRPIVSDMNVCTALDALFGHELPDRPHFDTFKGRTIGHNGRPVDGDYPVRDLLSAMSSVQLEGLSLDGLRRTYRNWVGEKSMNGLAHRFESKLPVWDGVPRLDTLLMDLFKPLDTKLNREFGRYFWLSLYNRINHPGCFAPMVLSLFGRQGSGKSRLSTLICKEVVGEDSAAVKLELDEISSGNFLRKITGSSVIANIGEMAGFTKGNLEKIKSFITSEVDTLDFKYENHKQQPRHWIIVMDGNKYEGLQRDPTGNRRFYPLFCGQLPDVDGKPAWDEKFSVEYEGFSDRFWQVMAECREWMDVHGGLKGYDKFVAGLSEDVRVFNDNERANDRGTVDDPELKYAFIPGMSDCAKRTVPRRGDKRGTWVEMRQVDIIQSVQAYFTTRTGINIERLETRLTALGGEKGKRSGTVYYFPYDTIEKFEVALRQGDDDNDYSNGEFKPGANKRDEF